MIEVSLILPDIRSTHNVGSIFRTSEIFGVKKIYIAGYTPYPHIASDPRLPHLSRKIDSQIHKTALGTEKLVPFEIFETVIQAIEKAKIEGNQIYALEQNNRSVSLKNAKLARKCAFILGREVEGVAPDVLDHAEQIVEIPQHGTKESLNIATATAILLYDISTYKSNKQ
ncbi:TrmH family RNA methyltransferase [Candidatus Saccharibacteria bacterium]|jgi:tRNA G18 (ribose-2'-O)-methylase SpoU|nr:TrmH family RNA methyltransferase [Candidatus Saccharibacteria bacterium]